MVTLHSYDKGIPQKIKFTKTRSLIFFRAQNSIFWHCKYSWKRCLQFTVIRIPCRVLSKLTVIQFNLPCTLLVIASLTYSVFSFSLKSLFIVYPHIFMTYKGRTLTLLLQRPIGLINSEVLNVDIKLCYIILSKLLGFPWVSKET